MQGVHRSRLASSMAACKVMYGCDGQGRAGTLTVTVCGPCAGFENFTPKGHAGGAASKASSKKPEGGSGGGNGNNGGGGRWRRVLQLGCAVLCRVWSRQRQGDL